MLDIAFGQGRGWLVHDQYSRIERKSLGDFDALAIADIQRADLRAHIQVVDIEFRQQRLRLVFHAYPINSFEETALSDRRMSHEDVLGHGQFGIEAEF